jgi:hypothetical protein
MVNTVSASPADVLAAELGAALPARKSALELERHFTPADQAERPNRGLFQIRIAESRLKEAGAKPEESAAALASLAAAEAEELEQEAAFLEPLLGPEAAGRQFGLLRLVCALFHLARLGEGRARASLSYARQGKRLLGFEDVLDLAPENELFFLALRRFKALLQAGGAWTKADADWLRFRAATAPGRLRLRAATLRAGAEGLAGAPLPDALAALRQPFIEFGFEPAMALAWAVAGFTPKQALAWGAEGVDSAEQAQAWRDRGIDSEEAACWAGADLLPDEAAAFKACGAKDPVMARSLRQAMGDVEHLLVWQREGFEMAEVLRLHASGVKKVDEAKEQRRQLGPPAAPAAKLPAAMPMPEAPAVPAKEPAPAEMAAMENSGELGPVEGPALAFWGLVHKTPIVPWGEALDFDPSENWKQRWNRKTAEWGDEGLAPPVSIGRTKQGWWWVGVKGSVQDCPGGHATAAGVNPTWPAFLSDFCMKMGMGPRQGSWQIHPEAMQNPEP